MAEKVGNFVATLLDGAITNVAVSLTVDSATGFPTFPFRIIVQDSEFDATNFEIMLVTNVAGLVFTVSRGQEGTAGGGVAHGDNSYVAHVLTNEGLARQIWRNYSPDNYPTSGLTLSDEFDDSALDGAWTWDTAPGGTVSESFYLGFLNILGGTAAAANDRFLRRAFVPGASTAFSAAMKGRLAIANGNFGASLGLYILSSADAIISGITLSADGTTTSAKGHRLFALAGSGTQWPAAAPIVIPLAGAEALYFLITRSTADVYICYWSLDGMTWQYMGTHTTATTVSKVAIVHGGDSDAAYVEANIDFVRVFNSVIRKIGA